MACELGYPLGQWLVTAVLIIAALSAADPEDAVRLARQAGQIPDMPGIDPQQPRASGAGKLSAREQELVTLVAQGRTDTQIASQLYISIRIVRSHLDRIRDKTGRRRRADLTRLALTEGLV